MEICFRARKMCRIFKTLQLLNLTFVAASGKHVLSPRTLN